MKPLWLILGLLGIGVWNLVGSPVQGQDRRFPYEAIIDVDEEFIRCGPGPKYYPTSKLKRGERVTVHRHDPGGWAMIAPPADSFSWIQSEYVQKAASGRGSLTANNVIVHVGSNLGDERGVYQRSLSKGDTVEVIGEQTFATERGPRKMYKIKPPTREYRWVAGKSIIPADAKTAPPIPGKPSNPSQPIPFIQGPIAMDLETKVAAEESAFDPSPFEPAIGQPRRSEDHSPGGEIDQPFPNNRPGDPNAALADSSSAQPENLDELEKLRQELAQLDQQFRAMLQAEPQTWDLASLKAAYQRLEQAADHPAFSSHVRQRQATIQRYGKIQSEYLDFYRITTETQERDAQLMSLQKQNELRIQQIPLTTPQPSAQPFPQSSPPAGTAPRSLPDAMNVPTPVNPGATSLPPPAPNGSLTGTPISRSAPPNGSPPAPRKFSGAGIVQRTSISAPGLPPYMLVAPDGRLLAYLEASQGVNLDSLQNQALGIVGERGFREELQADVIVVRGYQPVVLRTTASP